MQFEKNPRTKRSRSYLSGFKKSYKIMLSIKHFKFGHVVVAINTNAN